MIRPIFGPIQLSESRIRGMRASLNVPVLRIDELPPGPARAVVLAYAEACGEVRLAVALRSQLSGQVQLYAVGLDRDDASSSDLLLGSALKFTESMGFVFDGDLLGRREPEARARAFAFWTSFVSDPRASCGGLPLDEATQPAQFAEADTEPELLLVDRVDSEPAAEGGPGSGSASTLPLSKFRSSAGSSPLGRVALVRRSADAGGGEKPSLLLRLLGAF